MAARATSRPLLDLTLANPTAAAIPYPREAILAALARPAALVYAPRTRALLLVSPNNPTGSFTKTDELARLASLGLPLVSDEVFARYVLDDAPSPGRAATALDAADAGAPLVFALGGLSKAAGLPQM